MAAAAQKEASDPGPPPEEPSAYVEWAIELAGGAGKFQWAYLIGFGLSWAYGGMVAFLSVFAGAAPDQEFDCSAPRVVVEPARSYISSFDLVCEYQSFAPLLKTLYFCGVLFGVLFWGGVADTRGRRFAFFVPLLVQQLGVFGEAASPDYRTFALSRFLTGFGNAGNGLSAYMWMGEVLGKDLRPIMAGLPNMFFAAGQMSLSPLAYYLPEWRQFNAAVFVIGCGFFAYVGVFWESPKWLATQGRMQEAHAVLCACARMNGRPEPPPPREAEGKTSAGSDADKPKASGGAMQLLDRRLRFRFFSMCFVWFATSMGFYGLSMNAATLPLTIFMANVVGGLSCMPAYIFSSTLIESRYCGRRGAVAGGVLVCGICLLLSIQGSQEMLVALYYFATGAVSMSFAILYVWASELFPTDIRGTSIGMQSMCARVGAMFAPFVAALGSKESPALPLIAFASVSLAAGAVASLLPETRGQPPLGSIADLDKVTPEEQPGGEAELPKKDKAAKSSVRQRSASVGAVAKRAE